ncbi:hypothetical protein [Ereboglobus sp. PH5-5]|uniref:hypothetical protein n=1 Tax=Ereboglobus sp. PH5-5 TaxID=2940529 RepID=UPI00240569DC|nr:hypothetical protein [Ereboglobus sp. PH5-5]
MIPIGTSADGEDVVWSAGDTKIERRKFTKNIIAPVAHNGFFVKDDYYARPEYWLIENGKALLLSHVTERGRDYDPNQAPQIFGDLSLGRWLQVARYNIISMEYADVSLVLFNRNIVLKTVKISNCKRELRNIPRGNWQGFSIWYDIEQKGVTFHSKDFDGFLSLETGKITKKEK